LVDKPKFSVLIANYNNARFLSTALKSVYDQTYTNWEIIIVDDSSTDESIEMLSTLEHEDQIKVVYQKKNKGVGVTKREAVNHATGDIVGFLDPDDKLTEDALEESVRAHIEHPNASLTYSLLYTCDKNFNINNIPDWTGVIPEGITNLLSNKVSHFVSFKRVLYNTTAGIDKRLKLAEDKDLYYRLEEVGDLIFINKPLYYYRIHEGGIASTKDKRVAAYKWAYLAKRNAYLRRENTSIKNIGVSDLRYHFRRIIRNEISMSYSQSKFFNILPILSIIPIYIYPTRKILLSYQLLKY